MECIVADNGSIDDTPEVLTEYVDRIRVIRQQNLGPSAARNAGVTGGQGELVAFLDVDDWRESTKLTVRCTYLAQHPDIAAVGCGENQVDEAGTLMTTVVPKQLSDGNSANLRGVAVRLLQIGGTTSGVLMRKRVFEQLGGFDASLIGAEDYDLWLRPVAAVQVRNLPDMLLNRRLHSTGFARNAAM